MNLDKTLTDFLSTGYSTKKINDKENEVCDLRTGECHIVKSKDGIIERINKTFITEDGRQLLQD